MPASLWSDAPSPHQQHPLPHTAGSEGGGRHSPAAVPLFTAPDRGPRCAHGQQQQLEQYQPLWDPRTCKCSSIYNMMVCLQTRYTYKHEKEEEEEKLNESIKPNLPGLQTVQNLYCTLSISCARQPQPSITWHGASFPSGRHNVAPATIQL